MTGNAMDEVRHRFSHAGAADRWNAMYLAETERLEDVNFRERRDLAVDLVMRAVSPGGASAAAAASIGNAAVLDLGCGSGPVLSELRRRGLRVIGLDYSEDMLGHARQRLRSAGLDETGLTQGDCRDTPYAAGQFDVVVCLGVISYIEDYDPVIAEIHRIVKPGGTALISFRNVFNPLGSDPVALARRGLRKLLAPLLGPRPPAAFTIGRFLDHREVNRRVSAHGFNRRGFFGIGFGPFTFGGRPLFGERQSIRISHGLGRLVARWSLRWPQRWLADVIVMAYQKPAVAACPGGSATGQSHERLAMAFLPLSMGTPGRVQGGGQEGDGVENGELQLCSFAPIPHPHPSPPLEGEGARVHAIALDSATGCQS